MNTESKHPPIWDEEAYSVSEAARLLGISSPSSLRYWVGRAAYCNGKGRRVEREPVFGAGGGLLSFQDLAEAYAVMQLKQRGVQLKAIRSLAAAIREQFDVTRPFLESILVDSAGKEIFVEKYGRLESVTYSNQIAMRDCLKEIVQRITIEDAVAHRLFPNSRPDGETSPRLICIDPRFRYGRPVIESIKYETRTVAERVEWGETPAEIAKDINTGIEEIEEALRYEERFAA